MSAVRNALVAVPAASSVSDASATRRSTWATCTGFIASRARSRSANDAPGSRSSAAKQCSGNVTAS
jgi:hypothetical protein